MNTNGSYLGTNNRLRRGYLGDLHGGDQVSDITVTFHHKDLRRILDALRRFHPGEFAPAEEVNYIVELMKRLEIALGIAGITDVD